MKKAKLDFMDYFGIIIAACIFILVALSILNIDIALAIVICVAVILLSIIISIIVKQKKKKNEEIVKQISKRYNTILEINKKYTFNELGEINRVIMEREYSHKALDRSNTDQVILYHIENNIDNIREYILDAYRNKKIYDNYINEVKSVQDSISDLELTQIKMSRKKYYKIESKILNETVFNSDVYNISIMVVIYYTTPSGSRTYTNNNLIPYQTLCELYMQWRNGKKYAETSKRERKYLTNEMRYDVLNRDNFRCKKCGATAADGVKLHVDHIIPVSKGGQTTLSNLQTLCDRCNLGKGTKDN